MVWQKEITLPVFSKGMNLITNIITENLDNIPSCGLLHIFLKHTSAGLTINENADPLVGTDMELFINKLIPENSGLYTHVSEGPDDMPAHIKSSLFGQSLTIPIKDGKPALGTWQGIFLYEFRKNGGRRKLILTVYT